MTHVLPNRRLTAAQPPLGGLSPSELCLSLQKRLPQNTIHESCLHVTHLTLNAADDGKQMIRGALTYHMVDAFSHLSRWVAPPPLGIKHRER